MSLSVSETWAQKSYICLHRAAFGSAVRVWDRNGWRSTAEVVDAPQLWLFCSTLRPWVSFPPHQAYQAFCWLRTKTSEDSSLWLWLSVCSNTWCVKMSFLKFGDFLMVCLTAYSYFWSPFQYFQPTQGKFVWSIRTIMSNLKPIMFPGFKYMC